MNDVRVRVLYFAQAREAAGRSEERIRLPNPATVEKLLSEVERLHPKLSKMRQTAKVAVNMQLAEENRQISDGDEVAFLPPVVGG